MESPTQALLALSMNFMVGYCFHVLEQTLYSKSEDSKNVPSLPVEYIWKLVAMLPPIPDVPPPQAKKAFSDLLALRGLKKS